MCTGDISLVTNVPIVSSLQLLAQDWPFGVYICKLMPFIQKASVGITVLSLCALSIDRYVDLCSSHTHTHTHTQYTSVLNAAHAYVCLCSYHAVTSWSRVKGMGIPLWKAAEVTLIWLVAVMLAVPEALAYDMREIQYGGNKLRVCMIHAEQTASFIKVKSSERDSFNIHGVLVSYFS